MCDVCFAGGHPHTQVSALRAGQLISTSFCHAQQPSRGKSRSGSTFCGAFLPLPHQAHDEPLVLRSFRPHAALLLKMSHAHSEHWQTHAGHSDVLSFASRCHLLASESACVLVVRSRGLLDIRTECKPSCLDTRFHTVRRLRSFARLLLSLFSNEQRST